MNDLVKASIKGRRDAIFNAYEIKEQSIIDKIDELFNKIDELGETCTDNADFEAKFASNPLNQEYINLFTEIATKCKQKTIEHEENTDIKSDAEYIADDIKSEIKYQIEDATMPLRRQARQEAFDKISDIPGVSEALYAKQNIDLFNRFKKKKDKE